jgi:hypothetical protein
VASWGGLVKNRSPLFPRNGLVGRERWDSFLTAAWLLALACPHDARTVRLSLALTIQAVHRDDQFHESLLITDAPFWPALALPHQYLECVLGALQQFETKGTSVPIVVAQRHRPSEIRGPPLRNFGGFGVYRSMIIRVRT